MPLESGQQLLHYRLIDKIGEGGMGVVWSALDTSLDREVAIKVLPEQLSAHPDRLARFDREAKLLASLNHPNIATVYGLHQVDDLCFLAMELVPGEDLAHTLARGPLPVDEALSVGRHLCDALQAAHDKGVIHRDLKPANIRVTPEGRIKVLDFGLARGPDPTLSSSDPNASPTITSAGSVAGMVLGTAAYMSPEQARGKPVDRRTDMWAFGCVLYEMLTGRRAFDGETVTDILSAVISRDPEWEALPAATPPATRRLLRRCLQKNADQRVRDAADARLELADDGQGETEGDGAATGATTGDAAGQPTTAPPRTSRLTLILAAASLVVLVAILVTVLLEPTQSEAPPPSPERRVTYTGDVHSFDLAADGRTAIYVTGDRRNVILLDLDGGGSQALYTAPAGTTLYNARWSPDGDRVYLMRWPYATQVSSVPRLGGEPRQELDLSHLAGLSGVEVRPLADGNWLISGPSNTLYVGADPAGLQARGTQLVGEGTFSIPGLNEIFRIVLSRDGRWLAYFGTGEHDRPVTGVTAVGGQSGPSVIDDWAGLIPVGWTVDGAQLYLRRRAGQGLSDVLRVSVDADSGTPRGKPELVHSRLSARSMRISGDGTRLLFSTGNRVENLMEIELDGTARTAGSARRMRTSGTGEWDAGGFFPDGDLLAMLERDDGAEIFAIADDGSRRSITRQEFVPSSMAISPDGGTIALSLEVPKPRVLLHDVASGRSREIEVPEPLASVAWSSDGSRLAAMTVHSADHILVIDVDAGQSSVVTLDCGTRCEFAYEGIMPGPEWPWMTATSEVDTWVVNAETGALRHLATDTWSVVAWHDPWIYFARGGGQTDWPGMVLFRIPAEGGAEERLLDLPQRCFDPYMSPGGRSVICDYDESQLDLRVIDDLGGGR